MEPDLNWSCSYFFNVKNLIKRKCVFLKKYKNTIAILLCFFLIFGISTSANAQTYQVQPQALTAVEDINFI